MDNSRRAAAATLTIVLALGSVPGAAMDVRQSAAPSLERILYGLRVPSVVDRIQALNAIGQLNLDVPASEIQPLLDDRREDPAVRELAGRTLLRIAPATAMNSLRNVLVLSFEPESLRLLALEAAVRERDFRSVSYMLHLADSRAASEPLRIAAMRALSEMWPIAIPAPLVGVLEDRAEPLTIRRAAASALATLADHSAVPALLNAIDESDAELARLSAMAIQNVLSGGTRNVPPPPPSPATFDRLAAAYQRAKDAQDLRRALVQALAASGDPRAARLLIAIAENDASPEVRAVAVQRLVHYQEPAVTAALTAIIDNAGSDATVRTAALTHFAQVPASTNAQVMRVAQNVARNASEPEAIAAVTALGVMPRADAILVDLAVNERTSRAVRGAALRALASRLRPQPTAELRAFLPTAARMARREAKQPEDIRSGLLALLGIAGGYENELLGIGMDVSEPESVRLAALVPFTTFSAKPLAPDAGRMLGNAYFKEPSRRVRVVMLSILERGREEHRAVLRRVLVDPKSDPDLATAALSGLARQFPSLEASELELLATALADSRRDPADRARVISVFGAAALPRSGSGPLNPATAARVAEALRLLALDRREAPAVRLAAIEQLPTLAAEGSPAIGALIGLVRDRSESLPVRGRTASSLFRLRAPYPWNDLLAVARDQREEATLRRTVLDAIGNTVTDSALVPILITIVETDPEPTVRDTALRNLAKYAGRDAAVAAVLENELLRGSDEAQRVFAAWALARGNADRARVVFAQVPATEPSLLVRWAVSTYGGPTR